MSDRVKEITKELKRIEKALDGMSKIPQKYWTDSDSQGCQMLRMRGYKLLSELHKLTEKK